MFRFSLLRLKLGRHGFELSVGEVSTHPNNCRTLFGFGADSIDGVRLGLLWFPKWKLPISPGIRILDATLHRQWEVDIFGRFKFHFLV